MDLIPPEIEALLLRSLQGLATPAEEERLHSWRSKDPAHDRACHAVSSLWRMTSDVELATWAAPPTARRIVQASRLAQRRARRRRAVSGWAAVAAVFALSVGYLGSLVSSPRGGVEVRPYAEVTTGADERTTIELRDGTAIRLGPSSTLRVLDDGDEPVVWLEGRAFFGVRPDSLRNFTVQTDNGAATALGTRFEVVTDRDELRVLVVEGNVRVTAGDVAVEVGEGLLTRSASGGPPATERAENIEEMLAWMGAALLFRDTRLDRALAEIEYRYGVRVHLENPRLADAPVTATFTDQPIAAVMMVMCEVIGAECAAEDGGFRMR